MDSATPTPTPTKPIGRIRKSWLLTQSAWTALRQDKEILTLPLISLGFSLVFLAIVAVIAMLNPGSVLYDFNSTVNGGNGSLKPIGYIGSALAGLGLALIGTFISGAIIHAALERFKGNDPTVSSSLAAAWSRLGSLSGFAVFSFAIGYILSTIAERIPFLGGKIVAWLADAAWNVASFFAVPVIMDSDAPVSPLAATKQSLQLIRKTWGESLIASLSIGLISMAAIIGSMLVFGTIIAVGASLHLSAVLLVPLAILYFLVLMAIALVFNVLASFVKAAVYYYAVTGESPANFHKDLVQQAFTRKQARKVFGS